MHTIRKDAYQAPESETIVIQPLNILNQSPGGAGGGGEPVPGDPVDSPGFGYHYNPITKRYEPSAF